MFDVYSVQPVLSGQPVLNGHLTIPQGWPVNTGSTVPGNIYARGTAVNSHLAGNLATDTRRILIRRAA